MNIDKMLSNIVGQNPLGNPLGQWGRTMIERDIMAKNKLYRDMKSKNIWAKPERGIYVQQMAPREFLRRTGYGPKATQSDYEKRLSFYSDTEKGRRHIRHLQRKIVSPKAMVEMPLLGNFGPVEHEGRHRAYAAMLAGEKTIPVKVPPPKEWRSEKVIKTFMEKRFPEEKEGGYYEEWKGRFKKDFPQERMDLESTRAYVESLEETGVLPKEDKEGKDMAIRFGRRPRHMTETDWQEYQGHMNKLTHAEPSQFQLEHPQSKLNQITKMNTVLKEDRELKKLNRANPFFRDDVWHKRYNEEAKTALKEQGYDDKTADWYLAERNRVFTDTANKIIKQMKADEEIKKDEKSKQGGRLFREQMEERNIFAMGPKKYQNIFYRTLEKRPELLQRTETAGRFVLGGVQTGVDPKTNVIHLGKDTLQSYRGGKYRLFGDTGEEMSPYMLRKLPGLQNEYERQRKIGDVPGAILAHELEHHMQYAGSVSPEVIKEDMKLRKQLETEQESEAIDMSLEEGFKRYRELPLEKAANEAEQKPRERDIEVPQEKREEAFRQVFKDNQSKQKVIGYADGKPVIKLSKGKYPSLNILNNIYSKIPDDRKVPVVLESKKKYLMEYIHNQEKMKGIKFSPQEKQRYLREELAKLKPVGGRFTTYHNTYIEPRVVLFPDKSVNKKNVESMVYHEYGHELQEKNKSLFNMWKRKFKPGTSPTIYGAKDADEDFAESYAIFKSPKIAMVNNPNAQVEARINFFKQNITKDKQSMDTIPLHKAPKVIVYHGTGNVKEIMKKGLKSGITFKLNREIPRKSSGEIDRALLTSFEKIKNNKVVWKAKKDMPEMLETEHEMFDPRYTYLTPDMSYAMFSAKQYDNPGIIKMTLTDKEYEEGTKRATSFDSDKPNEVVFFGKQINPQRLSIVPFNKAQIKAETIEKKGEFPEITEEKEIKAQQGFRKLFNKHSVPKTDEESNDINLKDPTKYRKGSEEWDDAMFDNIVEKYKYNEELGGIEKDYVRGLERKGLIIRKPRQPIAKFNIGDTVSIKPGAVALEDKPKEDLTPEEETYLRKRNRLNGDETSHNGIATDKDTQDANQFYANLNIRRPIIRPIVIGYTPETF